MTMSIQTLTVAGKKFALVPLEDYRQLLKGARPDDSALPPLPEAMAGGNYPARPFMRASIARDIIQRRRAAGLSQAELARRADIQPAVLNRIEKAKVDAQTATVDKILAALGANRKCWPDRPRRSHVAYRPANSQAGARGGQMTTTSRSHAQVQD
jgi:DNA-binding XRE family transcriptional regulator